MKNILPPLTSCLLLLAGPWHLQAADPASTLATPAGTAQAAADSTLNDALARLAKLDSISAKLRQQMDISGQQLIGDGAYLQSTSGSDVLLRWELKFQVANELCSLLQVSDGRDLWVEQQVGTARTVQRIDTREVARFVRPLKPRVESMAGGRLPLGGLQEWLHSLVVNFQFSVAGDTELAGVPMVMLVGRWRKEALQEMLPDQKALIAAGQAADLSAVPEHLPQEVVLLLGKDDLFPYLIDYRRYSSAGKAVSPEPRSILRVQIYEVRLNSPLDLRQFVYQPGPVDVSDGTNSAAELLRARALRQTSALKK